MCNLEDNKADIFGSMIGMATFLTLTNNNTEILKSIPKFLLLVVLYNLHLS